MNKTAQEKETNHVESVILRHVCNLLVTPPLVEDGPLQGPGVADAGGGGEAAGVRQAVGVSPAPAGLRPVRRPRHAAAADTGLQQVHRLAGVGAHPVLLHAEVDPLLQGLAEGVSVQEGHQDTRYLHQQDSSDTDAVLKYTESRCVTCNCTMYNVCLLSRKTLCVFLS